MGYGFLIFDSKEDADEALSALNGQIMPETNKKFKLNHASFNNTILIILIIFKVVFTKNNFLMYYLNFLNN